MAIKYLDAKRLQGTNAERLALTTLGSAGWTNTGGSNIEFQSSNSRLWVDLDQDSSYTQVLTRTLSTTSNTAWVLRFKCYATSVTSNGSLIVVLSTNANPSDDEQRLGGFWWKALNSSSIRAVTDDNNDSGGICAGNNTDGNGGTPTDETDYYVTIVRDGDNLEVTVRTGSHTGSVQFGGDPFTTPLTSSVTTGLNTLKIMNHKCSSGGQWKGYLYDLEFYNGITSVSSETPTYETDFTDTYPSLPNGTIFNETDTYKYFMFDGTDTWNQMVSS